MKLSEAVITEVVLMSGGSYYNRGCRIEYTMYGITLWYNNALSAKVIPIHNIASITYEVAH